MKTNASLRCLAFFLALPALLYSQHSVGVQTSFSQREYVFDAEKTERLDFTGAIRLASGLGAGLSYQLAPRTHLYLMPRAELFFRGKIKTDTLLFWGVALGAWHDLNSGF